MFSWWSPDGWAMRDCDAYEQVLNSDGTDYAELLRDADYKKLDSTDYYAPRSSLLPIAVWQNNVDGHLMIETEIDTKCQPYFVRADDVVAFFHDRWPGILRDSIMAEQTLALKTIARCFVAFVRHGQGTDVIDANGETTIDELFPTGR